MLSKACGVAPNRSSARPLAPASGSKVRSVATGPSERIAVMRDSGLAEILHAEGLNETALVSRFYHLSGTKAAA